MPVEGAVEVTEEFGFLGGEGVFVEQAEGGEADVKKMEQSGVVVRRGG